jgi:hypothetical protein
MTTTQIDAQIARYADMFSAIGTEPRLRIMRLLLAAHPEGMVVFGEHHALRGNFGLSLCGVLHSQQGHSARQNHTVSG